MCVSAEPGAVTASRTMGEPGGMDGGPPPEDFQRRLTVVLRPKGDETKTLSFLSMRIIGSPETAEKSASVLCAKPAGGAACEGCGVGVAVGVAGGGGVAVGGAGGVGVAVGVGVGTTQTGSYSANMRGPPSCRAIAFLAV